ncbi:hypothetical protein Trydic_g23674 [Trypoxylus dichotomus]
MEKVARSKWRWAGYLGKQEGVKWTNHILKCRPRLHKEDIEIPPRRWVDDIRKKAGMKRLRLALFVQHIQAEYIWIADNPKFGQPIVNVTVAVGREAIIECVVENLATYKVAWLRVDTQTILTIQNHVITKNHRISVTHSEHKTWYLHIREVRETDRGWYMCQINTDPMKSQVGYLQVVVSPDIIDYQTSSDLVVQEGSDVSLKCVAKGSPEPSIIWKRENGQAIYAVMNREVSTVEGPILNINRANRHQMGPYLCIASNGVPPTVSKRIQLTVQFPPVIWIQYQLIGAYDGQEIILECQSEAFPKSINYWTRDKGEIVPKNEKYEPIIKYDSYKVHMKLIIRRIEQNTYGIYKCVSKNSLGETDGTINVYRIPKPAIPKLTNKSNPNELLDNNILTYQIGSSRRDSLSLEEGYKNASPPLTKRSLPYRLCPLLLTCIFWLV